MTNAPSSLLGLIIVLGVLIFVHEGGHFLVAKLFGVRVLVFSLGFGKRLLGFRRGGTDYRVSLIPLGGYVRMAGDTPEEGRSGAPDEFLSKPKWQRFLILVAGPFMNLLIAVAFLAGLDMSGIPSTTIRPKIGEIIPNKPAARAGRGGGPRTHPPRPRRKGRPARSVARNRPPRGVPEAAARRGAAERGEGEREAGARVVHDHRPPAAGRGKREGAERADRHRE